MFGLNWLSWKRFTPKTKPHDGPSDKQITKEDIKRSARNLSEKSRANFDQQQRIERKAKEIRELAAAKRKAEGTQTTAPKRHFGRAPEAATAKADQSKIDQLMSLIRAEGVKHINRLKGQGKAPVTTTTTAAQSKPSTPAAGKSVDQLVAEVHAASREAIRAGAGGGVTQGAVRIGKLLGNSEEEIRQTINGPDTTGLTAGEVAYARALRNSPAEVRVTKQHDATVDAPSNLFFKSPARK